MNNCYTWPSQEKKKYTNRKLQTKALNKKINECIDTNSKLRSASHRQHIMFKENAQKSSWSAAENTINAKRTPQLQTEDFLSNPKFE